ncbi:unnamed protein product [Nesidiocoris tenuis]|uniref:Uncharacterized protein n=1 Tax=Nesidiocoris tenuis TaxID=355587 RepID=A0A6H5GYG6_9HEMI|nr:unnamed protein product [Nesidiocoris tenuis]
MCARATPTAIAGSLENFTFKVQTLRENLSSQTEAQDKEVSSGSLIDRVAGGSEDGRWPRKWKFSSSKRLCPRPSLDQFQPIFPAFFVILLYSTHDCNFKLLRMGSKHYRMGPQFIVTNGKTAPTAAPDGAWQVGGTRALQLNDDDHFCTVPSPSLTHENELRAVRDNICENVDSHPNRTFMEFQTTHSSVAPKAIFILPHRRTNTPHMESAAINMNVKITFQCNQQHVVRPVISLNSVPVHYTGINKEFNSIKLDIVRYCQIWYDIVQYLPAFPISVRCYPLFPDIVQFGSIISNIVRYTPIWSDIVRCGPALSNMAKYCPIRSDTVRYCPILFDMFRYRPIWSNLV